MKTIQSFSWRFAAPFALLVLGLWLCPTPARAADAAPRQRLLLDANWKFHLGNDWGTGEELQRAGKSHGPADPDFKAAGWRTLDLPHDWAVELPIDRNSDRNHGYKPVGVGFPTNNVGWYRRTFTLPSEDAGKRLWLEFDGAFRDTRVFVNGYLVGHHESGYSSFRYDITDVANCGGKNVVTVRVDASEFEGWFYEGAGIYRHVWLVKTAPVAIAPDGTFVYSTFENNQPKGPAEIHVETRLNNSQAAAQATVRCQVLDAAGKTVAQNSTSAELGAWSQKEVTQTMKLAAPTLWSPESPALYKLVTTVESGGAVVDRTETEFGIRTTAWDADKGFLLNGQPYVIHGTCNHQDHAGVGVALPDRLQYFRVARLKEMGCNAYRTSHNPPTPELLEACDRLGLLVMDENRILGSDALNLDRLERLIRRDRNHPSVVVWCIGNEEPVQTTPAGGRLAGTMQRLIHRLDPTRSVTEAGNVGNVFQGLNRIIDVRGWNYNFGKGMDDYHAAHPAQPNVCTEQSSSVGTRGIYATDKPHGYVNAYDESGFPWPRVTETWWKFVAARPWMSGGFVWTGFDYRGEPSPFNWPCISSHFGVLDTCGFPKDDFYYYQAWWQNRPMVHLTPHWNWPGQEGQEIAVRCFSNCEEVELFLNGQSLGKQTMEKNSDLRWKVKYAPGSLSAKGYKAGQVVAEAKVETTGAPAGIKLISDRPAINADGEDISIITVAVADAQGRVVPVSSNLVRFELNGPGRILGVGNGDPSCHEADVYLSQGSTRSVPLDGWRLKEVPDLKDRPEIAKDFNVQDWRSVDVRADAGPLNPRQSAVFRTTFTASAQDLAASNIDIVLSFGTIDDEGWIYVNGQLAGESHDWSASPAFPIRKFLQEGGNTIAVVVKNNDGQGGLNKGVNVEIQGEPVPTDWKRSVFNGLAQIILQTGKAPGELKLTARSEGLEAATLSVPTKSSGQRPAVP